MFKPSEQHPHSQSICPVPTPKENPCEALQYSPNIQKVTYSVPNVFLQENSHTDQIWCENGYLEFSSHMFHMIGLFNCNIAPVGNFYGPFHAKNLNLKIQVVRLVWIKVQCIHACYETYKQCVNLPRGKECCSQSALSQGSPGMPQHHCMVHMLWNYQRGQQV